MTQNQTSKKLAIVTGSSRGIGRATALRLSQEDANRPGYHIIVHYNRGLDAANETLKMIEDAGGSGTVMGFDISDSEDSKNKLEGYFKEHPEQELAVLVNNAGMTNDGLLGMMSDQQFDDVIRTNLNGAFYLTRIAVKKMIRQRYGSIVNIASLAGQTGNPGQANYAASKAGMIAMTKSLAMELGSRNIRVNAVAPGLIETDMITDVPQLEEMKKRIPLKRFGAAAEVAGSVAFLCSSDASYISGHTMSVNGGMFPT